MSGVQFKVNLTRRVHRLLTASAQTNGVTLTREINDRLLWSLAQPTTPAVDLERLSRVTIDDHAHIPTIDGVPI